MNSIWNKNIEQFCKRFPQLAEAFSITPQSTYTKKIPWKIVTAKNGSITAEENGILLHSGYNPEREAQKTAESTSETAIFFSGGLGYGPAAFAKAHPEEILIIIEPDPDYFFAALSVLDWTEVFMHRQCIIIIAANCEETISLIERTCKSNHYTVISSAAQTSHAQKYFDDLKNLLERNNKKNKINNYTLERFAGLWQKNSCRNLRWLCKLDGVSKFSSACRQTSERTDEEKNLPALILAAGPTLSQVLPFLAELKKRAILICVDTALRACLKANVEPDFIIIVDPQYYAWLHIAGLSSSSSILITESASYPPVYRFPCKEKILCSSLFPLGKYFEKKLGAKGELGAGGSVSTTAWDFARLCGAKEIYTAGLDLGYPASETHIRGSTFEENAHRMSMRTKPAETYGASSLFAANMTEAKDYDGNKILTDDRMKLFAWWFESRAATYRDIQTYSLSSHSLAIPGFKTASVESLLSKPEKTDAKDAFFKTAALNSHKHYSESFDQILKELMEGLNELYHTARKGESEAEKALENMHSINKVSFSSHLVSESLAKLDLIDAEIFRSELKDIASLVFPTEEKLEHIFSAEGAAEQDDKNAPQSKEEKISLTLKRSCIIYRELQKAISSYRSFLSNC